MLFRLSQPIKHLNQKNSLRVLLIRCTTSLNIPNSNNQLYNDIYTDLIIDNPDHKPKMKYEYGDYSFEPTTYVYRKRVENNIRIIKYAYLVPIFFFILGYIQLQRFFRCTDLLEHARSRLNSDHVIHELPDDITHLPYQRVSLKGKFLFDKEIMAGPCLRHQCRHFFQASNLHIYTPFMLENGKIIWVDRGVISYQKYNNPDFDYQHYDAERNIHGFIMLNHLRGYQENIDEYFIADYDDMHIVYLENEIHSKTDIKQFPPQIWINPFRHAKWYKFWFLLAAIFFYNIARTAPKI